MNQSLFSTLSDRIWAGTGRREDLVQRVAKALRDEILSGTLVAGTKLVPEAEFSKNLGISRPSLREAIRILASEGLISVKHGVGTFVAAEHHPMLQSLEMMRSLTDLIRASGSQPSSQDLKVENIHATTPIAEALEVPAGTQIGRVSRVRLADDRPFDVANEYIRFDGGKRTFAALQGFTGGSLYSFLRDTLGATISHSSLKMSAVAADAPMAKLLKLKKGAPLLLMEEVHYGFDGTPVLLAVNYHNTEVVEFTAVRSGKLT